MEKFSISTYEVYEYKASDYRFRLKASNGENVLSSEPYTTKAACMNGIESVRENAPDATIAE